MRKCSIRDVDDAEAFVIHCIRLAGIRPATNEWEDTVATGLELLCAMSARYRDQLDGYTHAGCFSGWASKYLPGRIRDAYFASKENIVTRIAPGPDGRPTKTYIHHPPPAALSAPRWHTDDDRDDTSFDRALATEDHHNPLLDLWTMPAPLIPTAATAHRNGEPPADFTTSMLGALQSGLASEAHLTVKIAWLRGLDLDRNAIRDMLHCTEAEVDIAIERIRHIGRQLA